LLEIQSLSKQFGGLVANDDISFNVNEGEIVGLIGPNGAGKTTLFNCISGFYKPTRGRTRFAGHDITSASPAHICHLGLTRTFQIVRTFSDMSVLENVMVGAFARTHSRHHAEEAAWHVLELTGLTPKAMLLGSSLTIADKKRLELARALATQPRLLMLDEVMAGLTPTEQQAAVQLVRRIQAQGITILMVEHVMEVIMPIAVRLVVLNYGRKIAEGIPAEIVQNMDVIAAYLGDKYQRATGDRGLQTAV
jgi:branched-chain amino acid transport system ATP-binding protein